ncbi:transposase [Desulfonema magnum]|nr:transposase [Desulfonema magnum]
MISIIESVISEFRSCFSREAAFSWFSIVIFGLIIRFDHHGICSIIRWLMLDPACYDPMLRFFRASSWDSEELMSHWIRTAVSRYPLITFGGRPLLIGDGIKITKESSKMPGVKSLHQDSENSGKGEYIRGHHFGYAGILVGRPEKSFCLPLHGQIHEGVGARRHDIKIGGDPTIVTRMANLVIRTAEDTGFPCYVALDAYFSTGPAFLTFKEAVNEKGEQSVHLITRAKNNYVGYLVPENSSEKKFQEKDKVSLAKVFGFSEWFGETEVMISGNLRTVRYFTWDLFWKPVRDIIRFVFIIDGDDRYILMCSDLTLSGGQIITIYCYRPKVENMFRTLKHLIGGFCYHFWTKAFPDVGRGEKIWLCRLSETERKKFDLTLEAIERFVNLSGIALGLLQYLSLTRGSEVLEKYEGWLRTASSDCPSEGVVRSVIQAEFLSSSCKVPADRTLRMIRGRGRETSSDLAA